MSELATYPTQSKIKQFLFTQFGKPTGKVGRLIGIVMQFKNRKRINWALKLVNVQPNDKILEIGFGPGIAINQMAKKTHSGYIAGIDHSAEMFKLAYQRNSKYIQSYEHNVELHCVSLNEYQYPVSFFNKVLAINVSMFWYDKTVHFKNIKIMLKSGGKLFLIHQPRNNESIESIIEDTESSLNEAGFQNITVYKEKMKPADALCFVAVNE